MNRDDTRKLKRWWAQRRWLRRSMYVALLLTMGWAAVPLTAMGFSDTAALNTACARTAGCRSLRLCPDWSAGSSWLPSVGVCMTGDFPSGATELAPGTARSLTAPWLRPLIAEPTREIWVPAS